MTRAPPGRGGGEEAERGKGGKGRRGGMESKSVRSENT